MEHFRRDNRSGGRGGNRRFNDRGSGRPEMHSAVCSDCGKDCEVPFRPTGNKPVFCSNCFENKGNVSSNRSDRSDRSDRFDRRDSRKFGGDKKMYRAVCNKCGKDCEVPFRPSNDKPVYCDNCFGKGDREKPKNNDNKQLDIISNKLDKILETLAGVVQVEAVKEKEVSKKEVEKPKKDKVNSKGRQGESPLGERVSPGGESALGQTKVKEKKKALVKKEKPKKETKAKAKPKTKTKAKLKTKKKK